MFSRRFFIGSCIAASASAGCSAVKRIVTSKPIAKIGVLSDVHLKVPGDEDTFLKALGYFRDNGADGVLVAGDITDTGKISELKRASDAWFKIFPDGRSPDGRKVEQLFILGNHDRWGWRGGLKEEQLNDPAILA
ncbi:MAG: metallophosphoesterase, partial [Kiritimatiellae bacterium]|nr:metallophosphoesterase [Kiritimatiellia bacterium]